MAALGALGAFVACASTVVGELPPPVPVTFVDGGSDPHASCTANGETGCAAEGETCELASHANRACNATAQCVSGAWIDTPAAATVCEPAAPCLASAAAQRGTACVRGPGALCAFANALCGCALKDGGTAAVYACVDAPAPCPFRRPALGTACVLDITCDYGACAFDLGSRVRCEAGTWRNVASACP